MDQVFRGLIGVTMYVYIDDIIIFSKTLEDHYKHIKEILARLEEANLRLNLPKCQWAKKEVKFLGVMVSHGQFRIDPDKIQGIANITYPRDKDKLSDRIKQVQKFLGAVGWNRRFIYNYAQKAKPLTDLLKRNREWKFGEEEEMAWNILKEEMISTPILRHPDYGKEFFLDTDASYDGIGAALLQMGEEGEMYAVAYISRVLTEQETKYSARDLEMLAIYWACRHLKGMLTGRTFTIITDHSSVTWAKEGPGRRGRAGRGVSELETNFDFYFIYRRGRENVIADFLSRWPAENTDAVGRRIGVTQVLILKIKNREHPTESVYAYPVTRNKARIIAQEAKKAEQKTIQIE